MDDSRKEVVRRMVLNYMSQVGFVERPVISLKTYLAGIGCSGEEIAWAEQYFKSIERSKP